MVYFNKLMHCSITLICLQQKTSTIFFFLLTYSLNIIVHISKIRLTFVWWNHLYALVLCFFRRIHLLLRFYTLFWLPVPSKRTTPSVRHRSRLNGLLSYHQENGSILSTSRLSAELVSVKYGACMVWLVVLRFISTMTFYQIRLGYKICHYSKI